PDRRSGAAPLRAARLRGGGAHRRPPERGARAGRPVRVAPGRFRRGPARRRSRRRPGPGREAPVPARRSERRPATLGWAHALRGARSARGAGRRRRSGGGPGGEGPGLLAALLVHGGAPVSADRLIEDLWEGRPPGRPLNTLQTKVSQLRRALGAEQVPRTPAGYRLRLEAGGLDAARFRDAVEEAHRAGGPSERARLLTGALRLWRGPAYADFAGAAFARDEAARLEELRLDAAECLAEARIELGDADGALPDLRELVGAHPLRERL